MVSRNPGKKEFIYIVVIVVLLIVLAFSFLQNTFVLSSQNQVVDNVKNVYGLLTENDVEILTVEDEGHLYRILLRLKLATGDVLREVFATKDGKFLSEAGNVIEVSDFTERLEKERDFANCLKEKEFILFGQSNEQNTVQQILTIGNFASKVYVDCVDANLQACQQLGIEQIPTIAYEGKSYTGLKTREWIEELTGCEY